MAHQTSNPSQKQSTPHSIGRLMDADLFGGQIFSYSLHVRRLSEQVLMLGASPHGLTQHQTTQQIVSMNVATL